MQLKQLTYTNPKKAAQLSAQTNTPKFLPNSDTANLLNNALTNYQFHLKARNAHMR